VAWTITSWTDSNGHVAALDVVPLLTPEVCQRIDTRIGDYSESWVGGSPWHYDD
jgi:hypothetical protein